MKRTFVTFGALSLGIATALVIACGDDDPASSTTNADGGVVVGDGGVVFVEGGVAYIDGGYPPYDAGPSTCGDASSAQPLGTGVYGCGGKVSWDDRNALCKQGCRACTGYEWKALHAPQETPAKNFWLADRLSRSLQESSCRATTIDPTATYTYDGDYYKDGVIGCGPTIEQTPMRVCADTSLDPESNECNWYQCGYETTVSSHFGGCSGNVTAGSLCCGSGAVGCAAGTNDQTFNNSMAGCKGKVTWADRDTLCAAGFHTCSAQEWIANTTGAPTHHYWTKDYLRYSGFGPSNCSVTLDASAPDTFDCTSLNEATSPMRICGAGTNADSDGNRCATSGCSLLLEGESPYFGGCGPDGGLSPNGSSDAGALTESGYATAGTVCCCDPE